MKRFQSLLASFVLTFVLTSALAASAAAGDGIIHTGSPAPSPTPSTGSSVTDEGPVEGETAEGEATTFDLILEAALDGLYGTLTLF
jgi:hypothetical protein